MKKQNKTLDLHKKSNPRYAFTRRDTMYYERTIEPTTKSTSQTFQVLIDEKTGTFRLGLFSLAQLVIILRKYFCR